LFFVIVCRTHKERKIMRLMMVLLVLVGLSFASVGEVAFSFGNRHFSEADWNPCENQLEPEISVAVGGNNLKAIMSWGYSRAVNEHPYFAEYDVIGETLRASWGLVGSVPVWSQFFVNVGSGVTVCKGTTALRYESEIFDENNMNAVGPYCSGGVSYVFPSSTFVGVKVEKAFINSDYISPNADLGGLFMGLTFGYAF
jgi:hypothetical protein